MHKRLSVESVLFLPVFSVNQLSVVLAVTAQVKVKTWWILCGAEEDGWPHRWECLSCCLSLGCWTTMVGLWLVEATAGGMSIIRWQTSIWNAHSGEPVTLSQPWLNSKYFKQPAEGKNTPAVFGASRSQDTFLFGRLALCVCVCMCVSVCVCGPGTSYFTALKIKVSGFHVFLHAPFDLIASP